MPSYIVSGRMDCYNLLGNKSGNIRTIKNTIGHSNPLLGNFPHKNKVSVHKDLHMCSVYSFEKYMLSTYSVPAMKDEGSALTELPCEGTDMDYKYLRENISPG